jgi:hypothetical protein
MGWTDKLKNKKDETKGATKEQLGKTTDDEQMEREARSTRPRAASNRPARRSRTP